VLRKLVACGIVALTVASCSDSGPSGASGSVSFSYTNAGAGASFNASGVPPAPSSQSFGDHDWAAGGHNSANTQTAALGAHFRGGNRFDLGVVSVASAATGTYQVASNCDDPQIDVCTGAGLFINLDVEEFTYDFFCVLDAGTITITSLTSSRIEGTFSGTGLCTSGDFQTTQSFTVSNGTFNVPIVPGFFD